MTDKEKILAEIKKRVEFQKTCIKTDYRLNGRAEEEIILEYQKLINFINSLPEETVSEEQPEYSFFEYTYRCGKKPHWNIDDTLAYYELTSNCEGENILGKVTDIEFDEECNDWFYTFDNGNQSDEETLLSDNTYKKN